MFGSWRRAKQFCQRHGIVPLYTTRVRPPFSNPNSSAGPTGELYQRTLSVPHPFGPARAVRNKVSVADPSCE